MPWAAVLALLVVFASPAMGQEFIILGGTMQNADTPRHRSFSWQLEYLEGLGEHAAVSLSYLNEGHVPVHHRDGHALLFWGRTSLLDRRLSLAAGAGPYFYYDTTTTLPGASYANEHGWGAMFSLAATWYTESRWLFQLRANRVETFSSIDTMTFLAGLGYQLEAPPVPGPLPKAPLQREKTTDNEITLFVGRTIVNSFGSEEEVAASIEYRRGVGRQVDWTIAWLNEGDHREIRRNGLATQFWGVKEFLDDRLALGAGGGAYLAVDRHHPELLGGQGSGRVLSGIVTLTGSYRFHPHWALRTSWNRIVTDYHKDSDVILAGIGYRF